MPKDDRKCLIGLALSGGGARAIAFHLGCMRALQDRRILDKIQVISTVSGGSVIGACWAYRGESFEDFDRHVVSTLRRGLQRDIVREVFLSWQGPKILATLLVTGSLSLAIGVISIILSRARRWAGVPSRRIEVFLAILSGKLPIWGSLTTAFEAALERNFFGKRTVDQVQRPGLTSIVNACDLRTGTAFRFGSIKSGGWRYGSVVRSWLLDLTANALKENPDMNGIAPWVADSGEGRWTVFAAIDEDVPAPVITLSLMMRFVSRQDDSYGAKLLASMRNQFGGHAIKKE